MSIGSKVGPGRRRINACKAASSRRAQGENLQVAWPFVPPDEVAARRAMAHPDAENVRGDLSSNSTIARAERPVRRLDYAIWKPRPGGSRAGSPRSAPRTVDSGMAAARRRARYDPACKGRVAPHDAYRAAVSCRPRRQLAASGRAQRSAPAPCRGARSMPRGSGGRRGPRNRAPRPRSRRELGLRGITDGELRRSWWWHLDFLWGPRRHRRANQSRLRHGLRRCEGAGAGPWACASKARSPSPVMRCSSTTAFLYARVAVQAEAHDPGAFGALLARPVLPPRSMRRRVPDDEAELYRGSRRRRIETAVRVICRGGLPLSTARRSVQDRRCSANEKYRDKMRAQRGDDPDALVSMSTRSLINTAV